MARLQLRLLDGFDLQAGPGHAVPIRLKKTQALLAYLACHPGQSHPRDKLATSIEELELAQLDVSTREAARADVSITPVFGPGTWRHMQCDGLFLSADRQAAEAALERLTMVARPKAA